MRRIGQIERQTMKLKMKMPDLSANEAEIKVVRWLVEPGDPVQRGQPLLEVETDKATVEVESIASGIFREALAAPDEEVEVGALIAAIEVENVSPLASEHGGEGETP